MVGSEWPIDIINRSRPSKKGDNNRVRGGDPYAIDSRHVERRGNGHHRGRLIRDPYRRRSRAGVAGGIRRAESDDGLTQWKQRRRVMGRRQGAIHLIQRGRGM